jgi:hypothetical protein
LTDEELLISKGWEKEATKNPKCWYKPREPGRHGVGRYDLWSALKIQKWLEVGREAGNATKTKQTGT